MRVSWWGTDLETSIQMETSLLVDFYLFIFIIISFLSWGSVCFVLHGSCSLIKACCRAIPCDASREGAAPLALPAWVKPHTASPNSSLQQLGISVSMLYFSRLLHSVDLVSSRKPEIPRCSLRTTRVHRYLQEVPELLLLLGAAVLLCLRALGQFSLSQWKPSPADNS